MPLVLVYAILCDPLYTAMFFVTIAIFLAGVFLGSQSRRVSLRVAGGVACLLSVLLLDLHNFYRGLFGYAACAVFPNELYCEVQTWRPHTVLMFQGGWGTAGAILLIVCGVLALGLGSRQNRGFVASVPRLPCFHGCHFPGVYL